MNWLHVLVATVDIYLLISLGPWIALQVMEWLLQGSLRLARAADARLQQLEEGASEQALAWPNQARPGRYQEPDRLAQEGLAGLRAITAEATRLSPRATTYASTDLKMVDILCLRSWKPLLRAIAARRGAQALSRLLDQADETLANLREQLQVVREIPTRVRASLNETRAESRRLQAILEAEQEAGTLGLKEISQRLDMTEVEIEQALDALAQSGQTDMPLVVQQVDQWLGVARPTIEEIRDHLDQAAEERRQAQNLIARVGSCMGLAEERWEGLKLRGAREPSLESDLSQLQAQVARLSRISQRGTLDAYQQANDEAKVLDVQAGSLMDRLDALDQVMVRSREAAAGSVQALAQAQTACDELVHQDPWLDFDQSQALIEESAQAYLEAERQRSVGTTQSYEASISLAETARQHLAKAQEAIGALPDGARQIRELFEELRGEALDDWRGRIDRVRGELQSYKRHWASGLAQHVTEAIDKLNQAGADVQSIPSDVRSQHRLRQSEMLTVIETLSHARSCVEEAKEITVGLENERQRIEGLRRDLESGLEEISKHTIPSIREQTRHMLPELQERFRALEKSLQNQAARFQDPDRVDYDEATSEWLPSVERRLEHILAEHENSLEHYRAALKDASRRIERAWARLAKLNPHEPPGPEEDVDQLVLDLDAWHAEAERASDDPSALRQVVGRQVTNLEQRIEAARLQIVEGRRSLDDLDRQYHKCAQATRNLRNATRDVQNQSHWPKLTWSTDQAQRAWEEAIRLERESRAAPTLAVATDQVQRAIAAASRAEQLYARVERQMSTAFHRLDEETRSVAAGLERARRKAAELRERGLLAEMGETEEFCARAERILEMAESATTFEDALWHLRDASRALNTT